MLSSDSIRMKNCKLIINDLIEIPVDMIDFQINQHNTVAHFIGSRITTLKQGPTEIH